MSASSPYVTFRAEAWMRQSLISPRKSLATRAKSAVATPKNRSHERPPRRDVVQGELFLFPVIVSS